MKILLLFLLIFSQTLYAVTFGDDDPPSEDITIPTDSSGDPLDDQNFLDWLEAQSTASTPTGQCKEVVYDLGRQIDASVDTLLTCEEEQTFLSNQISLLNEDLDACFAELDSQQPNYDLTGLSSLEQLTCPEDMVAKRTFRAIVCVCTGFKFLNPHTLKCERKHYKKRKKNRFYDSD